MAKQIKPVALLSPGTANKKNGAANAREIERGKSTAVTTGNPAAQRSATGKAAGWSLAIVLMVLLFTPKPELIVYQQLNVQAKSLYWPGIFGFGAGFTDSQMEVYFDDERREMRLCYAGTPDVHCSKYQIIQRGGLIDVGRYLLNLH